jgi:hypothetical protein
MAAAVVGEIGQASDVVEMRVGQEHMLDPELLGDAEHGRDRASLEENRAVEQETGRCRPGADPPWQPSTVRFMASTLAGRGVKAR